MLFYLYFVRVELMLSCHSVSTSHLHCTSYKNPRYDQSIFSPLLYLQYISRISWRRTSLNVTVFAAHSWWLLQHVVLHHYSISESLKPKTAAITLLPPLHSLPPCGVEPNGFPLVACVSGPYEGIFSWVVGEGMRGGAAVTDSKTQRTSAPSPDDTNAEEHQEMTLVSAEGAPPLLRAGTEGARRRRYSACWSAASQRHTTELKRWEMETRP